jgi:aryl-alcohol dehydrogenase-like predicted oxidoreductase
MQGGFPDGASPTLQRLVARPRLRLKALDSGRLWDYAAPMKYRALGRTGFNVSTVSMGCWAIGGAWGKVDDKESMAALHTALDNGVNFFDTADVYGDGHSERLLAQLKKERKENFVIASKAGRRLSPHAAAGYNAQNLTAFLERTLKNLNLETLDLLQLHCPPTDVYYQPETFAALDGLVQSGKLRYYGVSVERVEEGLKALEYPGVQSIQIIYNVLRQRPAELLFKECLRRKVGVLARVPLASGILTGKLKPSHAFEADDHRQFNRHGEAFDRGETFSGVDYALGLEVAEQLKPLVPAGASLAQWALAWTLSDPAVTCAIPGARRPSQVLENVGAAAIEVAPNALAAARHLYDERIRPGVHHYW